MDSEAAFSHLYPPILLGDNYDHWYVRMEVYLKALDLWDDIEEEDKFAYLPNNP